MRRDAIFAIYALARRIDDVADGPLHARTEAALSSSVARDELATARRISERS